MNDYMNDGAGAGEGIAAGDGGQLVCYCFGYTVADIQADARSGRDEIPARIARESRDGNCQCAVKNPSGH